MSTVNLYDVLEVDESCTSGQIKAAYNKLLKKYHPDKIGGDSEMFELITHAYSILHNQKSREEYDNLYRISLQSEKDHFSLKNQSKNYNKISVNSIKKKNVSELNKEFNKTYEELDRKHKYKRNIDDKRLNDDETMKFLQDIQNLREHDDIENIHEQIFEDGKFDTRVFNSAFEEIVKLKDRDNILTLRKNPEPWCPNTQFDSFNSLENYDNLYLDTKDQELLQKDPLVNLKLTKKDINKIKKQEGHTEIRAEPSIKDVEARLQQREAETGKFSDFSIADFNTDAECGGYGIFADLGIKDVSSINWEDHDDLKLRYNRLLELRNNN